MNHNTQAQQTARATEQRTNAMAEVRMVVDGLNDLCAKVREQWPERYPIPADLDALLKFQDYALARVRSGSLRQFAELCQDKPTRYDVSLSDLVTVADAARDLDESRKFHVDQPDEQQRLAGMVQALHDIIERAAHIDARRIYGEPTC